MPSSKLFPHHPLRRSIRRRRIIGFFSFVVCLTMVAWYWSDSFLWADRLIHWKQEIRLQKVGMFRSVRIQMMYAVVHNGKVYVFDRNDSSVPAEAIQSKSNPGVVRSDLGRIYFRNRGSSGAGILRPVHTWSKVDAWIDLDYGPGFQVSRFASELLTDEPPIPLTPFENELRQGIMRVMSRPSWGTPTIATLKSRRVDTIHWDNLTTNTLLIGSFGLTLFCFARNRRDASRLRLLLTTHCLCGYPLAGLGPAPTCPECGFQAPFICADDAPTSKAA